MCKCLCTTLCSTGLFLNPTSPSHRLEKLLRVNSEIRTDLEMPDVQHDHSQIKWIHIVTNANINSSLQNHGWEINMNRNLREEPNVNLGMVAVNLSLVLPGDLRIIYSSLVLLEYFHWLLLRSSVCNVIAVSLGTSDTRWQQRHRLLLSSWLVLPEFHTVPISMAQTVGTHLGT